MPGFNNGHAKMMLRVVLFAVNLMLHLLMLALFMSSGPKPDPHVSSFSTDIVWITPKPPPRLTVKAHRATPIKAQQQVKPQVPRAKLPYVSEHTISLRVLQPDDREILPAHAPATDERTFNHDAALASARAMANEVDPARESLAVAQFDRERNKITPNEATGRAIARGKRSSCIGPNPAADLLTPIFWLLDKKGHGCKF